MVSIARQDFQIEEASPRIDNALEERARRRGFILAEDVLNRNMLPRRVRGLSEAMAKSATPQETYRPVLHLRSLPIVP